MLRTALDRRVLATLFWLGLLFAGCDHKSPSSQQESPTVSPLFPAKPLHSVADEQPSLPDNPQKSCGDDLPKDIEDYPVIFYPVVANYSEKNFELIKKHFCGDAFRKSDDRFDEFFTKDIVQIASFNNRERANKFKEEIAPYLSDVNVGNPHLIKGNNYASSKLPKVFTTQKIDEIKRIVAFSSLGSKILLPRYVPNGFEIFVFFVTPPLSFSDPKSRGYRVIFLSQKDKRCFSLGTTFVPRGASVDSLKDGIIINSPALKHIFLQYNTFSNIKDNPIIKLDLDAFDTNLGKKIFSYFFESGTQHEWDESIKGQSNYDKVSAKFRSCQGIELREAIKIIESIDYIDQKHPANISFHTGR